MSSLPASSVAAAASAAAAAVAVASSSASASQWAGPAADLGPGYVPGPSWTPWSSMHGDDMHAFKAEDRHGDHPFLDFGPTHGNEPDGNATQPFGASSNGNVSGNNGPDRFYGNMLPSSAAAATTTSTGSFLDLNPVLRTLNNPGALPWPPGGPFNPLVGGYGGAGSGSSAAAALSAAAAAARNAPGGPYSTLPLSNGPLGSFTMPQNGMLAQGAYGMGTGAPGWAQGQVGSSRVGTKYNKARSRTGSADGLPGEWAPDGDDSGGAGTDLSMYRMRNRSVINTKERNRRNEQSMLLATLRANVPDFKGEGPLQSAKKRNVLLAAADYIKQLEDEEAVLKREKDRLRAVNEHLKGSLPGQQAVLQPQPAAMFETDPLFRSIVH